MRRYRTSVRDAVRATALRKLEAETKGAKRETKTAPGETAVVGAGGEVRGFAAARSWWNDDANKLMGVGFLHHLCGIRVVGEEAYS